MFINLTIQQGKDSEEAKRSLTNLIEVINKENLREPRITLKDKHILALQDNVEKFNDTVINVEELKARLLEIFKDVTSVGTIQ